MNETAMIKCENLVKIYKARDIEVVALQGLDLVVQTGEIMAVVGNSGSGKSTLLNVLGGIDRPSAGTVVVAGHDLLQLDEKGLCFYRTSGVGFIWQHATRNLVPWLNARENVETVLRGTASGNEANAVRVKELLELVGLAKRSENRISELSGGEQQRVAVAIALANRPPLILGDEPTGALDTATTSQIFDLFREIHGALGTTFVIVTHDRSVARRVDRIVNIRDGRVSSEYIRRENYAAELSHIDHAFGEAAVGANAEAPAKAGKASAGKAAAGNAAGGGARHDYHETHDEMLVLDRAGRLQLPASYVESLNWQSVRTIRARIEKDKVVLYHE